VQLKAKVKLAYRAFGLQILSEIILPELNHLTNGDNFDVFIKYDDQSKVIDNSVYESNRFTVENSCVMFHIPELAIFKISGGREIIVSPLNNPDHDKIRLYILGTCLGVILMQRQILPLHGSAIAIGNKSIAIVGHSGAGKSTLASAFIREGYKLLTDDVIAVSISKENNPVIHPSYPHQKLWEESLIEFNMDPSQYSPLFERENKYSIPISNHFDSVSKPLMGVFELVLTEGDQIGIRNINGLEQFRTLLTHTFRSSLISRLDLSEWHFKHSSKVISKIKMYQVERPISKFTAKSIVRNILDIVDMEGIK
jgi:GTPase SAR1 family protein